MKKYRRLLTIARWVLAMALVLVLRSGLWVYAAEGLAGMVWAG